MSHQIRKQSNIIAAGQEIFSEPVAEGVWIYRFLRNTILSGTELKLAIDPAGRNGSAFSVAEQKTGSHVLRVHPSGSF